MYGGGINGGWTENATATEFQKTLDHGGYRLELLDRSVAALGVARANSLQAKTSMGADADVAREHPDSTATEYVRMNTKRKHPSHAVASPQLREWLARPDVLLDLISYHIGIDRHTLRSIRDGSPVRREVLAAPMELKRLWKNTEQCGALAGTRESIRRSRRDYEEDGELRDRMLQEKNAMKMG